MFVMQLIQAVMVTLVGVAFMMTAGTYGMGQAPRLKSVVLFFSLAILATAALGYYLHSELEEGAYLTEAILLTIVGLGGLAAVIMSGQPKPNQHNAPIVGALSAGLLFVAFLVRDELLERFVRRRINLRRLPVLLLQ